MKMFHIKHNPNENIPTQKYLLPKQKDKEIKALEISDYITDESKHNLTT